MKDDDDDEVEQVQVSRYPVMPSLVTLQQMKNRLHLAKVGRKLMKWTALATAAEARKCAAQIQLLYEELNEEFSHAYILLARSRFYNDNLNKMVIENVNQYPKRAIVKVRYRTKSIPGCKQYTYDLIANPTQQFAYEHFAIEKGGQTVLDAKLAWYELLRKLVLIMQLKISFKSAYEANKAATKREKILRKYFKYTSKELKKNDAKIRTEIPMSKDNTEKESIEMKDEQKIFRSDTKSKSTPPTCESIKWDKDDPFLSNFDTDSNNISVTEDTSQKLYNMVSINEFFKNLPKQANSFHKMDNTNIYQTRCHQVEKNSTYNDKAMSIHQLNSHESNDSTEYDTQGTSIQGHNFDSVSLTPLVCESYVTRSETHIQEDKQLLTIFTSHPWHRSDCQLFYVCDTCQQRQKSENEEATVKVKCETCGGRRFSQIPPEDEVSSQIPPDDEVSVNSKPSIFYLVKQMCELCKTVIQKTLMGSQPECQTEATSQEPKRYYDVLAKPKQYIFDDNVCDLHNARISKSASFESVCNVNELEKRSKNDPNVNTRLNIRTTKSISWEDMCESCKNIKNKVKLTKSDDKEYSYDDDICDQHSDKITKSASIEELIKLYNEFERLAKKDPNIFNRLNIRALNSISKENGFESCKKIEKDKRNTNLETNVSDSHESVSKNTSLEDICEACKKIESKRKLIPTEPDICDKHNAKPKICHRCKEILEARGTTSTKTGSVGTISQNISKACCAPDLSKVNKKEEPINGEDNDTKSKTSQGFCKDSCDTSKNNKVIKLDKTPEYELISPRKNSPQNSLFPGPASRKSEDSAKKVSRPSSANTNYLRNAKSQRKSVTSANEKQSVSLATDKWSVTTARKKSSVVSATTSTDDLCAWHSGKIKKCKFCTMDLDSKKENQLGNNCSKCSTSSKIEKLCPVCFSKKQEESKAESKSKTLKDIKDVYMLKKHVIRITDTVRHNPEENLADASTLRLICGKQMNKYLCNGSYKSESFTNSREEEELKKLSQENSTVNDLKRMFCSQEDSDTYYKDSRQPNDLIKLVGCLTEVMAITKHCQNKGLLSTSAEAFHDSCKKIIHCIKQKQENEMKIKEIMQLKLKIRILEQMTKTTVIKNPVLNKKIQNFHKTCLDFENKIDSKIYCESQYDIINGNQSTQLSKESENGNEFSTEDHELMPGEMTAIYMNFCASQKEGINKPHKIQAKQKDKNVKSLINGLKQVSMECGKKLCKNRNCPECNCDQDPVKMLMLLSMTNSSNLIHSPSCISRRSSLDTWPHYNTNHIDSCISLGAQTSSFVQCCAKTSFSDSTNFIQSYNSEEEGLSCTDKSDATSVSTSNNARSKKKSQANCDYVNSGGGLADSENFIDNRLKVLLDSTSCLSDKKAIATATLRINNNKFQTDEDKINDKTNL